MKLPSPAHGFPAFPPWSASHGEAHGTQVLHKATMRWGFQFYFEERTCPDFRYLAWHKLPGSLQAF